MHTAKGQLKVRRFASWSSSFPFNGSAIRLHEMAWIEAGADFRSDWSAGMDRVLFVYILSGSGRLDYLGDSIALTAGQSLLVDLKPGYSAYSDSGDWSFLWIQMSGALANSLLAYIQQDRRGYIFQTSAEVLPICERIYTLAAPGGWSQYADIEIAYSLYHLLGILHSAPARSRQVEAALRCIQAHYMEPLPIEALAKECGMSPYHFIRRFKEELGIPPHTYINLFRVNKAKALLLESEQSIAFISAAVGFEDPSYFARLFKKLTGYLPREFRQFSGRIT